MSLRWYEKQLRMQQTVLREPDIVDYDADDVVKYLADVDANCLIVNAGGIIDFFRHDLPTANPNPFMTDQDIIADLVDKCHAKDIKVLVRVDFRGVDRRIYDLHPDWFQSDEHGEPVRAEYLGQPLPETLYVPCYLSYYRNEHAFQFASVLMERYDIDGIWENSPSQNGVCYCQRCRTQYRADTGEDLPRGGDFDSAKYDAYRVWKGQNLLRHLKAFRAKLKDYGEDKAFCAEIFGLFYENYRRTSTDLYQVKEAMDFMVTPLFIANHEPLHAPSTLIKFLRALDPDKVPVMLYGHLGTNNQLRYVSNAPSEAKIWTWQAVSAGGSLWDCTFNGQHPGRTFDRRNAYLAAETNAFMKKHEALLSRQRPLASVKILYSKRTSEKFGNGDRQKDHYISSFIGLEQTLLDRHIQYDFILDLHLTSEALAGTKVLIVPNAAILTDREIDVIRRFVADGGQLLATHHTSLYDEAGNRRDDFALGDVFGCTFTGVSKDMSLWGYQRVAADHPLTRGLDKTELLANWGDQLLVRQREGATAVAPLTYLPRIFPQPPERSWLRSMETDYPTVVVNDYGKGQCVYFASDIDRNVWAHGHRDFAAVLGNAVDYLVGDDGHLTSDAPVSVQIALNEVVGSPGHYLLHLINLTSAPRRPVESVLPVFDFGVRLVLPGGKSAGIELLRGDGSAIEVQNQRRLPDGTLEVQLHCDKLQDYACVLVQTTG